MEAREDYSALVEPLLPMVRSIARHLASGLPRSVAIEDLVSAGRVGLVEAARRYRPDRGARFSTFAYYRVRGAMIDSLRRQSASDPRARAYASTQAALDDLIVQHVSDEKPPTANASPELAARTLASLLEESAMALVLAETAEMTAAEGPEDPETASMARETARKIDLALASIPDKERQIVTKVYLHGETIESAGQSLGLTKSWSSRLHARGLKLLKQRLRDLDP